MRLRNIKDKSELSNSQYIISDPYKYTGKYHLVFKNKKPIQIEIGMGKGKFIMEMALKYPEINFIGIEKFDTVMIRAIQRIGELELPNLRLIVMDAMEIDQIFDKEIDLIYLNFSDPWPKLRHAKRRLSSDIFLKKYDGIFSGDKKIIMKTDNQDLFEYSVESLSEYGYELDEVVLDLHSLNEIDNVMTEYETRFALLGKPIYRIKASKRKE